MKGWTVVAESTKNGSQGVASREGYFLNASHQNHAKTTHIESIWGSETQSQAIAFNGEKYAAQQKANGKGGRPPSSFAMEFTLNFPKGYRPTPEQWKEITKKVITDAAKALGIKAEVLSRQCRAVLHQQDQTPDLDDNGRERGTGDHLHLLIGKFTPKGNYLRDLQRKTIIHVVKNAFNNSSKHVCGYDWTEYRDTKLKAQEHANRRRVPRYKIEEARAHRELDKKAAELDTRSQLINKLAEETDRKLETIDKNINILNEKADEAIVTKRLIKKFDAQIEKWLEALDTNDHTQLNRQANRLDKSLIALEAFGLLSEEPATMEAAKLVSHVTLQIDKINQKQPETLKKPTITRLKP